MEKKEDEKLNNYRKNRLSLVNDFNDVEDDEVENDIGNMDATSFMDVLNNIPENVSEIKSISESVSENISTNSVNNNPNVDDSVINDSVIDNPVINNPVIDNLNLIVSNLNNDSLSDKKQTYNSKNNNKNNNEDDLKINVSQGTPYIYINNSSNITIQFTK